MNKIFTLILAAVATTTTVVVPQDAQAQVVHIGSATLTPTTTTTYYTYSDAAGLTSLGSTLPTPPASYNVAASINDGTLNLTFKNLKVKKCRTIGAGITPAVYISNNNKTVLTLEDTNSLQCIDNEPNSSGLLSNGDGDLEITGAGTLDAIGGKAINNSYGVNAYSLTINLLTGGKLTATGGEATNYYSFGIIASHTLSVQGSGTIVTTGGKAVYSCGVYANSPTINLLTGGKLTTKGDNSINNSYGLYDTSGKSITIYSGIVTAQGNKQAVNILPTAAHATIKADEEYDGANAATTTLIATDIANYKYLNFNVPINIKKATITGIEKSYEYTGSAIKPVPTVTLEGKTLVAGTDYTVAYKDSIEVGTATITITGINDYGSTKDTTFLITPFDIAKTTVEGIEKSYEYTGSAIKPAVTVKHNTMTLTEGTDYTVAYNDSIEIGTATVIITGIGNYTGTQKITFEIMALDIADATIEGIDKSYEYTGSAITPVPTVTLNGKTLKEGTDYTVSYGANKQPGTATVTITGIGIYKGTQTVKFNINRKPVTYYVTLPQVEGAATTPAAGVHAVKSGETFTFTITLDADYSDSKPIVKLFGKTITPNIMGEYVINNISYDADITITGITKNTATAIDGVNGKTVIWASKGSLKIHTATPQQMQVISLVGSTVLSRNIPAGDTTIDTLSAGFYIVRLSSGTTEKVMIR